MKRIKNGGINSGIPAQIWQQADVDTPKLNLSEVQKGWQQKNDGRVLQ